ncbi:hypothetical protein GJ688_12615 [Heliobacillus mobilis]|uniref:Uncharacterized protein n=1 Tax=Heliobacterium mobile TaxID=28064 RepID=A0A6I3SLK7_HELMO|nr:hypothetical protein [Heliobacterium mobile]MTV49814.1 hypothetical protein [Heliobacterium mobile]
MNPKKKAYYLMFPISLVVASIYVAIGGLLTKLISYGFGLNLSTQDCILAGFVLLGAVIVVTSTLFMEDVKVVVKWLRDES